MRTNSLIRTIYLYLFALVGLFILIFGFIGLIKLGLTTWVFPESDSYYAKPAVFPLNIEGLEKCKESCDLSQEDKETLSRWLEDYRQQETRDYGSAERQRQLANNLAMIIVGLPLYLYHWLTIKKETQKV